MAGSRSIFEIDLYLLLSAVALVTIGVLFVYSSGVTADGVVVSSEYLRQVFWALSGLVLLLVVTFLDYRLLLTLSPWIYAVAIVLLAVTLAFGRVVNGARSWLGIGGFGVQPSEFAKIATILVLARFLGSERERTVSGRWIVALGIAALPAVLTLLQPDLGTAMVFFPLFLFAAFAAGVDVRVLLFLVLTGAATIVLMVAPVWQEEIHGELVPWMAILTDVDVMKFMLVGLAFLATLGLVAYANVRAGIFFWIAFLALVLLLSLPLGYLGGRILKDYQVMRLLVFLDPYVDPQGHGWNIIQSTTAVGSGGVFGKGFLQGTQSHYRYLPQQSTDFIFSILSEEWGFAGGVAVLGLFMLIIARGLYIAASARDRAGGLIAVGTVSLFFFHTIVNVGMAIGVMPITGIPLFLLSYGGSSTWTAMVAVGLMMSIYQHRYQY